jgi:hypothetical protein
MTKFKSMDEFRKTHYKVGSPPMDCVTAQKINADFVKGIHQKDENLECLAIAHTMQYITCNIHLIKVDKEAEKEKKRKSSITNIKKSQDE